MQNNLKGYTLIELLIVVAIIGTLAATSIPIYERYVVKAQIELAISELGAYRSGFESNLANGSAVNNETLGYTPSSYTNGNQTKQVGTVNTDGSGHLQVTLGGKAHTNLTDVVLRFERTVAGDWVCVIDKSAASRWKPSYAPASCSVL